LAQEGLLATSERPCVEEGTVARREARAKTMCMPDRDGWQRELKDLQKQIASEYPGGPTASKTIYFVRHAESTSNVARESISRNRIRGTVQLCAQGFDSALSDEGRRQLLEVRPEARRIEPQIEAVLHSPLKRAAQTARTLFGDEDGQGGYRPSEGKPWFAVKALKEMKFKEHAQANIARSESIMRARVLALIEFVALLPFRTFALVGHSRFFTMMLKLLGARVRFVNASVWEVSARTVGGQLQCTAPKLIAQPSNAKALPSFMTSGGQASSAGGLNGATTSTLSAGLRSESDEEALPVPADRPEYDVRGRPVSVKAR